MGHGTCWCLNKDGFSDSKGDGEVDGQKGRQGYDDYVRFERLRFGRLVG